MFYQPSNKIPVVFVQLFSTWILLLPNFPSYLWTLPKLLSKCFTIDLLMTYDHWQYDGKRWENGLQFGNRLCFVHRNVIFIHLGSGWMAASCCLISEIFYTTANTDLLPSDWPLCWLLVSDFTAASDLFPPCLKIHTARMARASHYKAVWMGLGSSVLF